MPAWVAGNPVPPEVRLGKVLQNEFHILRVLGEGELGVTYEAENSRLKGKFAVLMLRRELKPTQGMMLSVQKDLRAAQPLQALGLMPVKMIVDQFDIPGFATELLDGETLRQRLRRGPLSIERALALVIYIGKALEALHKAGAVHGDLRPENIFLVRPGAKSSFAGKVVIVEHSMHHLRRRPAGLDDQLPLYKLMYRPPELLAGETGPHPGGDVFVLGAILHECLTSRPAFFDEVADFVIDNLHQPPKKLQPNPQTGLTAELCKSLDELTECACARDPKERLPDITSLIAGLEALVKATGLKLPDVLTETPGSVDPVASQAQQRMNQLLERRSGVFPVLGPPPEKPADKPAAPPPSMAPAASPPGTEKPAPVAATPTVPKAADPMPQLQAITAPKKKVTQILQQLSTAFPVLTVSPDGGSIEEQIVQPQPSLGKPATPPEQPTPTATVAPSAPPAVAAAAPVVSTPIAAEAQAKADPAPSGAKENPLAAGTEKTAEVPKEQTEKPVAQEDPAPLIAEVVTQPKVVEAKPVLKAGVAEALARLRKPAAPVELKGPPPVVELPFAVPNHGAAAKPTEGTRPPHEPPKTAPPLLPEPTPAPSAPSEPPKTAPPLLSDSSVRPEAKPSAEAAPPDVAKPSSPRRVSESTLQVENVEDLLVSLPSLAAIPIVPPSPPPPPPSAKSEPQTLSAVPTSVALESMKPTHDADLLNAKTKPLLPAMLGDLLTPPVNPAPPPSLNIEAQVTPAVTAAPNAPTLHEQPTRTKLPVDGISMLPTQAAVEAIPASALGGPSPVSESPSGRAEPRPSEGLHEKPTAASIPSLDLLSRLNASSDSGSAPDPHKLLESNPIVRPDPTKEPSPPIGKTPTPSPEPKPVLPAQVSTSHTSFAPRRPSSKPVALPSAPEPGLRQLLLKNQEVVAAAVGALLVLLIGLLFYAIIR